MSTRIRTPRGKRESAASTSMDRPEPMIIQEEIVMTPLKAKAGSQMIRVERVSSGILDEKKVHYSAEGPYKGIVVNKATNVKRKKKEPETVRRLIAYVHDEGETTKEVREIRFWFKPETNSGAMEDYSDKFFRELIDPKNFPKDHLQFVKRLLTLVQKYSPLKSVELEMRPHTANDDDDPFWTEARQRRRLRKATSAAAAVDAPGPRPVRQSTSTDDLLHGGRRRRRVRRLTVGGTDPPPPQPPTDRRDPATVFVYKNANDGGEEKRSEEKKEEEEEEKKERKKKKKKGKGSGSESGNNPDLRLRSGGGSENLNGVGIDDSDVFGHSDETQHISDVKLKKRGVSVPTSTPTEANGNTPNNVKESKTSDYPIPIYGVVKKNRTTSLEAASSPSELETVVLTRSPRGPSRSGHHGQSPPPPPPLPVEKRRSTGSGGRRRPKSSASLTATGAVTPPPTTPVGESRTGSEDAPEKEPTAAAVNGRRSSGRRARKDPRRPPEEEEESSAMTSEAGAKVVGLLEDAFPSMLPVDDLIRMSKMAPDAVESALRMLQAAGMAAEAESGFWVRSQVPRRIKPSSPGGNNSSGQEATDLYRNEFRMVASVPSLAAEDQPTIAIITSMYCEKQAVDTMMDVKKTYVRYKAKGEGLVYTVGLIDRHRIVSTKLSRAGPGSETTKWSAENTVPRLLEAFGQIEHVLLVGVGGGVANDDGDRVCLGDVVVSKATDRTDGYVYFHVTGSCDRDQSITLETRPWSSVDSELQSVVAKMQKSPKKLWRQMDAFIAEATAAAAAAATSGDLDGTRFARPPAAHSDDGAGARERRTSPRRPVVHFGPVAAGKILTRDGAVRTQFCLRQGVKAVDAGFQRVLDSLEETRSGAQPPSYLIVRGVADYGDGTKAKEWLPYAALAAAAVMKCVVMRLSLPGDDDGVV